MKRPQRPTHFLPAERRKHQAALITCPHVALTRQLTHIAPPVRADHIGYQALLGVYSKVRLVKVALD